MASDSFALTNYFNYFTEIEEHFQRARGTSLFLLSPLDWALIESWKSAGVPLEAVLRGIDIAFEKWRARRIKTQNVNSLAFCAQAVLTEAQRLPENTEGAKPAPAPFAGEEVKQYIQNNARLIRKQKEAFHEVAIRLEQIAEASGTDLEMLEQQLTTLEEKLIALARSAQTDDAALEARRELETQLRPYRGKMTAPQLALLEQQYLERKLLDTNQLPRLSLFYLR